MAKLDKQGQESLLVAEFSDFSKTSKIFQQNQTSLSSLTLSAKLEEKKKKRQERRGGGEEEKERRRKEKEARKA